MVAYHNVISGWTNSCSVFHQGPRACLLVDNTFVDINNNYLYHWFIVAYTFRTWMDVLNQRVNKFFVWYVKCDLTMHQDYENTSACTQENTDSSVRDVTNDLVKRPNMNMRLFRQGSFDLSVKFETKPSNEWLIFVDVTSFKHVLVNLFLKVATISFSYK